MAEKKKKIRRVKGKIPIAMVAGFAPAIGNIISEVRTRGLAEGLRLQVPKSFLGYNPADGSWGPQ